MPWEGGDPGQRLPHRLPSTEENSYQGSVSRPGPRRPGSCVGGPLGRQPGQGRLQLKKQTSHLVSDSARRWRCPGEVLWCRPWVRGRLSEHVRVTRGRIASASGVAGGGVVGCLPAAQPHGGAALGFTHDLIDSALEFRQRSGSRGVGKGSEASGSG